MGLDTKGYGYGLHDIPEYQAHLKRFGLTQPTFTAEGVGWQHNPILAGRMNAPLEASEAFFTAQRTIDRMDALTKENKPFFLACCFWGPHAPYLPCEPYASMYDPKQIEPWGNFQDTFDGKPGSYRKYRDAFIGEKQPLRTWDECAKWAALYFGYMTQFDAQNGWILQHLEILGHADDTVVIFSTDHGDLCGAHGGMHDKNARMVQELYHIPFIVRDPRAARTGTVCDAMISNLDIPATVADLANADGVKEMDGRSLLPLLRDAKTPSDWPDHAVAQTWGAHFGYEARMIVTDRWKYVFNPADTDELYDLKSDPWELHNLINEPAHAQTLRGMRDRLMRWLQEKEDPIAMIFVSLHGDRSHCGIANAKPYR